MNTEERDLITRFVQRAGGRPAAAGGAFGSVPSTAVAANPLPPVDAEADALLADLFTRYPEARYRITQMAFVQEHALVEAQNRINRLEWEVQQARQAQQVPTPQQPAASPWGQTGQQQQQQYAQPQVAPSRGLFGGLFGGRQDQQPQQGYAQPQPGYGQPPPPQYAPGYQPGMFQQRGSGFLGSALTTAAGVAGGMVAGNALMNMFSGGHGAAQAASNPVADAGGAAASPWAATPEAGQGAWTPVSDQSAGGWSSPTSYETPAEADWTDTSSDDGGWTDPDQG